MKNTLLGKTGIEVSRVGMGVLPVGPNQLALPVEENKLFRYSTILQDISLHEPCFQILSQRTGDMLKMSLRRL